MENDTPDAVADDDLTDEQVNDGTSDGAQVPPSDEPVSQAKHPIAGA